MDHLEPAIFPLTAQSDLIQHKKARQIGQITDVHPADHWDRQPRASRAVRVIVEPKLLHHVRIAPLRQAAPLAVRAQTCFARRARLLPSEAGARNRSSSRTQARATLRTASAYRLAESAPENRPKSSMPIVAYGGRERCSKVRWPASKALTSALQPDETAASTSRETRICAVSS